MTLTTFDHVLMAFLVGVYPIVAWHETRKVQRRIAEGVIDGHYDPVPDYRLTIAGQCVVTTITVAGWLWMGRSWTALGLGPGDAGWGLALGLGIAAAGLVPTAIQAVLVRVRPSMREHLRERFEDLAFFLPKTPRQFRWFAAVAVTAGTCEELLFRGFLIAYYATFLGEIPAMIAAALAFGLVHIYQGPAKAFQIAGVGLWMGALYLATGALWVPMVTHTLLDLLSGGMISVALRAEPPSTGATSV